MQESARAPDHPAPIRPWDVFCHVVDNLGDIGVCWRLCADLARRGQQVRLWIDQPEPLRWMAPGALEGDVAGVQVLRWRAPLTAAQLALPPAGVWIEAFGCELPTEFVHSDVARRTGPPPRWINLEYLSAEPYVERSHLLPSPVMSGPARGRTKVFFYPGFTGRTGGLLREADLASRQAGFNAHTWRERMGLADGSPPGARWVSLFCYEPAALPSVLAQAGQADRPSEWLVTPGRAWQAVQVAQAGQAAPGPACRLHALPALTQHDFDHLLWACDLNFVRGEDSLVRALWAGQPFVWHIYPQHDDAHHAKLAAFLDWLEAPASLRAFHLAWNAIGTARAHWPADETLADWRDCTLRARARLLGQQDLVSQLLGWVAESP
ncbi:elongation factor P maturation arginine rhamnosyltransferase EarP [Hydrogenophaga sp.]|uniref:elongation factor P maturation arginine rhamnosyltransferase EarP n=1 Tax=Hydrogenophaga sp. TaxID=1904254 RepID=UPI00262C782A|nr:elongation factor P maturation arginine rhamnosyltransferase EarP [Hydrogenophaga sp.]MCW5652622.1 elongation factor P maturation arginine rhamnosyltransferase EarP [Hydrogenophaga sp.]